MIAFLVCVLIVLLFIAVVILFAAAGRLRVANRCQEDAADVWSRAVSLSSSPRLRADLDRCQQTPPNETSRSARRPSPYPQVGVHPGPADDSPLDLYGGLNARTYAFLPERATSALEAISDDLASLTTSGAWVMPATTP
jgi:hypothetical protein